MKKTIYVIISAVFGVLLSFIVHAVIEIKYLNWADSHDLTVDWHSIAGLSCALSPWLSTSLFITGIIFGVWLGFNW